jgi:phosphoenolpyruvate carboxylase
LDKNQRKLLESVYRNLKADLQLAGRFVNKDVVLKRAKKSKAWEDVKRDIEGVEEYIGEPVGPRSLDEKEHHLILQRIAEHMEKEKPISQLIEQAGILRKSLG